MPFKFFTRYSLINVNFIYRIPVDILNNSCDGGTFTRR